MKRETKQILNALDDTLSALEAQEDWMDTISEAVSACMETIGELVSASHDPELQLRVASRFGMVGFYAKLRKEAETGEKQ